LREIYRVFISVSNLPLSYCKILELEINLQKRLRKGDKPNSESRKAQTTQRVESSNNLKSLAQKWRVVKENLEKQNHILLSKKVSYFKLLFLIKYSLEIILL